mmetsp:Transcript_93964/g.148505  ORF Transcript_93964/g.148505 Transcript_93964/m.148505 type:complete len:86 (+) Transcript_93964:154-411(+)
MVTSLNTRDDTRWRKRKIRQRGYDSSESLARFLRKQIVTFNDSAHSVEGFFKVCIEIPTNSLVTSTLSHGSALAFHTYTFAIFQH